MFYRFLSKLATQERLEAFPVPLAGSNWKEETGWMPYPADYEEKFKPLSTSVATLGVEYFQAPFYTDSGERGLRLHFFCGKEAEHLPDIWGVEGRLLVSETFKTVLESVDDMTHEYIPIKCIDREENTIPTAQPYYWFNQRRFLHIDPSDRIASHLELGFCPIDIEENFLARVLDTPSLREQLDQIPLWQHYGQKYKKGRLPQGRMSQARCVLYMNQKMVEALSAANISGIERHSRKYGVGEESLCGI